MAGEPILAEGSGFLRRVTPGNWLTIGFVVVSFVFQWANVNNRLTNQSSSIDELKASIARLAPIDALSNLARDTDKDMATMRAVIVANQQDFKVAMDAISARVSLLGERTNDTSREAAQLATEVQNIKEAITELRRQARVDDQQPPARTFPPSGR